MIEFYKEVARYRAYIEHERTGEVVDYRGVVYAGPQEGMFSIRHSHTFYPVENAIGPYFSNSYTSARSADEAESLVNGWTRQIASSYQVVVWNEDLTTAG